MNKIKYFTLIVLLILTAMWTILKTDVFAYVIPENDSQIKYFYVFGPDGNSDYGAESDHELSFYIDIPEDAAQDLIIDIFDPDTGGDIDSKEGFGKGWDTTTEFSVYGHNNTLLNTKQFGQDCKYDRKYFTFGPYLKKQGEKLLDKYRFKLKVKTLKGSDANLFNFRITPESAQVFTYKVALRLVDEEGKKMCLYPLTQ